MLTRDARSSSTVGNRQKSILGGVLGAVAALLLGGAAVIAAVPITHLVSGGLGGSSAFTGSTLGPYEENSVSLSQDGRYVTFVSNATNLAAGTGGKYQVYLRDRQKGTVELMSRSTGGVIGNSDCRYAVQSADGRLIFFTSKASNLVPDDTNFTADVFVHDRESGITERISLAANGDQSGGGGDGPITASAAGRFVAFVSYGDDLVAGDTNGTADLFVRDRDLGSNDRVTVATDGTHSNSFQVGVGARISNDGRYVVFDSVASSLVPGDTNGTLDVFLRDRVQHTTERVNLGPGGEQANGDSRWPSLSADGRYVAFASWATNLSPDDTNDSSDIFVWERLTGTLQRVNETSVGVPANQSSIEPAISDDGRYVTFTSSATNLAPDAESGDAQVYLKDRLVGSLNRISVSSEGVKANGPSHNSAYHPVINADGRRIVFLSSASNLAPGDTNGRVDAFVRDRLNNTTERVSAGIANTQGVVGANSTHASVSANARFIAFASDALNLVDGDTNETGDVFVWDRNSGAIELASVSSADVQGNAPAGQPAISADGRFVAFVSPADNLAPFHLNQYEDVFVRDRVLGHTECVSLGPEGYAYGGSRPSLSADGRFVAFVGSDWLLPDGAANDSYSVFVKDRRTGILERVSVGLGGGAANAAPEADFTPQISADGGYVTFISRATNLVASPLNPTASVFVRDRLQGSTTLASVSTGGLPGNGACWDATLSSNGRFVVFSSGASNLTPGDGNNAVDIFLRDLLEGTTELVSHNPNPTQFFGVGLSASISADGRFISYNSPEWTYSDGVAVPRQRVLVRDRVNQTTTDVDELAGGVPASGLSETTASGLSADGRLVAFSSTAGNLVGGNALFGRNLYLWDTGSRGGTLVAPGDLNASAVSASAIQLTWTDHSSSEGAFEVERSSDAGVTFAPLITLGANTTGYVDSGLAGSTLYTYRVRATDSFGASEYSGVASATTQLAVPETPGALVVTPVSAHSLQLSWTDRSALETGFKIERSTGNGSFAEVVTSGVNTASFLDTGLTANSTYTYRVRATNNRGDSSFTTAVSGLTFPAVPTDLAASAEFAHELTLQWSNPGGPLPNFQLEFSSDGGSSFGPVTNSTNLGTSYRHFGLPSATTYGYRIRAINASGTSAPTSAVFGTTLPDYPLGATQMKATALSDSQIKITWKDVSTNETAFELVRTWATGSQLINLAPDTVTYTDSGLQPGTDYRYDLRAVNSGGASGYELALATTYAVPGGKLSVKQSVNFGKVKLGSNGARALELRNTSRTAPLRVALGKVTAPFSIMDGETAFFLAPGAKKSVQLQFAPAAKGARKFILQITSSDAHAASVKVKLTGSGK